MLRDGKEKILNKLGGLCLDCVKTERKSLANQTCRFEHFEIDEDEEDDMIS